MPFAFWLLTFDLSPVDALPLGVQCQTLIISDGVSTVYRVGSGFGDSPDAGTVPSRFLVPGTDTVYVSGVRLDSTDYVFDYNTGSIVFWRRPEKWAPIRVAYRCVRFPGQPREYRLRSEPVAGGESEAVSRILSRAGD